MQRFRKILSFLMVCAVNQNKISVRDSNFQTDQKSCMTNEINLLSLFRLQLSGKLIQNARGFYVQKRDRMESHKKSGVESYSFIHE